MNQRVLATARKEPTVTPYLTFGMVKLWRYKGSKSQYLKVRNITEKRNRFGHRYFLAQLVSANHYTKPDNSWISIGGMTQWYRVWVYNYAKFRWDRYDNVSLGSLA